MRGSFNGRTTASQAVDGGSIPLPRSKFMMTTVVHCRRAPYDVLIDRTTKYGNPYRIGKDGNRKQVITKYREYLRTRPDLVAAAKVELPGKVLGCWCKETPTILCHGDVLAEIANGDLTW